jgi:hypothetical protein
MQIKHDPATRTDVADAVGFVRHARRSVTPLAQHGVVLKLGILS